MKCRYFRVLGVGLFLAATALCGRVSADSEAQAEPGSESESLTGQNILLFTKTLGWRHKSIPTGIKTFGILAERYGFNVAATEDASVFNDEALEKFDIIVFMNTTGDVLNADQQSAMERFIRSGKGFLGIHSATDTEKEGWPWYNDLVGGIFREHPNNPNIREGELTTIDQTHPATRSLPKVFKVTDEFYDFRYLYPKTKILVTIDEGSYNWKSSHGDFHPMVWYHAYDGGRAFYTALGHTSEMYDTEYFRQMIVGGLTYVAGP